MVYEKLGEGVEMSKDPSEKEIVIVAKGDLGPKNQGGFGPETPAELNAVDLLAEERYAVKANNEWHCMDDRLCACGGQLAGGRIWSEVAGELMDPAARPERISGVVALKTRELVELGNDVYDHGDEKNDEEGCAAKKFARNVLSFNAEHKELVAPLVWGVVEIMNLTDHIQPEDIEQAIDTGGQRAFDDAIWDADTKQLTQIIKDNGGKYEVLPGEHKIVALRTDTSENIFDNNAFREEFGSGALSVTLGAYKSRLQEESFSDSEVAAKVMHAALFAYGASKILLKEGVDEIIVGTPASTPVLN